MVTRLALAEEIVEFPIPYPNLGLPCDLQGSTHEMAFHQDTLWVTGQNYDQLIAVRPDGQMTFYAMPESSGPHGLAFDNQGQLWLALEFAGEVIRLDPNHPSYESATKYDVKIHCDTCTKPINTHPHGLAIAQDGETVWYTGKATGTLGRIRNEQVETFPIGAINNPRAIVGSVPIYLHSDPENNMWFTELVGNAVGYITPMGEVKEFKIPTLNSRPIAITLGADGKMWFSEEASNKIGSIKRNCEVNCITEFSLPQSQDNQLLAALSFDHEQNLWVQQYIDGNHPLPLGKDRLIKIEHHFFTDPANNDLSKFIAIYNVPSDKTILHRIIEDPNNDLWFTELKTDKLGKVSLKKMTD